MEHKKIVKQFRAWFKPASMFSKGFIVNLQDIDGGPMLEGNDAWLYVGLKALDKGQTKSPEWPPVKKLAALNKALKVMFLKVGRQQPVHTDWDGLVRWSDGLLTNKVVGFMVVTNTGASAFAISNDLEHIIVNAPGGSGDGDGDGEGGDCDGAEAQQAMTDAQIEQALADMDAFLSALQEEGEDDEGEGEVEAEQDGEGDDKPEGLGKAYSPNSKEHQSLNFNHGWSD